MNKNKYALPKSCPNCDSARFWYDGNRYIGCKDCAWMDRLEYYRKDKKEND